ncbi:MAG TPA: DUF5666 domain-containing protein [Alphaproteobacteria bacterium]|nr:DUF5666 domain-containing protein [Alphaproteobacteria bacterium]
MTTMTARRRPISLIAQLYGMAAAAFLFVGAPAADAQAPQMKRVRGVIAKVDGGSMSVKARDGATVKITLGDNVEVLLLRPHDPATIAPGSYVGAAATPQSDGTWRAIEVTVFPDNARNIAAEGQFPWDLTPDSTMTNASVSAVVTGGSGRDLTLSVKGQPVKMAVPNGTPVVTFSIADRAPLKAGAHVFAITLVGADGSLAARRILVGQDGLIPPM